MSFAQRITHLKPEGAYAVFARAQELEAQGREIIHLEIGQPDFETFDNVALAGIRAIAAGKTRYNPPAGIPELRQALAQDAGERRGVRFDADQVVVAPGNKPLMLLSMMAVLEPGDEVIYPDPGFPTYTAAIGLAGAKAVPVPLSEKNDFDLDLAAFHEAVGPKTRMIILNSPGNPTGSVLSHDALVSISRMVRRYNCWVLSDEIYHRLVYNGPAESIVSLPGMTERTILIDGFSKTYAMTGWRLGYGIMPRSLAEKIALLLTHTVGCTATFTQYAGLAAIRGPQGSVDAAITELCRRRDVLVTGLNDIPGICCAVPNGAFYAFPNVQAITRSSDWLAEYLLEDAGVALLPGTAFGENGEGYLRLSYANSVDAIREGLLKIHKSVEKLA